METRGVLYDWRTWGENTVQNRSQQGLLLSPPVIHSSTGSREEAHDVEVWAKPDMSAQYNSQSRRARASAI